MRKLICILLGMAVMLCLCACDPSMVLDQMASQPTQAPVQPRPTPTTTPVETTPATTIPTVPLHSELYIEGVSPELMTQYFGEVVLAMEYSDGTGDPTVVQKWLQPIYYTIIGTPTEEDLRVLEDLFTQLNQVEGFPGIYPADYATQANLTLNFLDEDAFYKQFSEVINNEEAYGAVHYWFYLSTNEIYEGRIGYRTDISQQSRNSVLVEEIINLLGITDTVQRTDSITYQYSNEATVLSPEDWVILKILYNPKIQSGMNEEDCKPILEELYY